VPADVSRPVYERDGGQCAFVDARGRRCQERGWLQVDHVQGFGLLPDHTTEECRLLCFQHNQYEAEVLYGREYVERKRAGRPEGSASMRSNPR